MNSVLLLQAHQQVDQQRGVAVRPVDQPTQHAIGIRPEDVEIRGDGLPGAIRVVEPLGPHKLLTVDVAGHLFRAVVDNEHAVEPGQAISLRPKPGRGRWFDAETGLALQ